MPYSPQEPPMLETVSQLREWVRDELRSISREFSETLALELRTSFREPVKPRAGMIVHADGVSWDPGAGLGVYVYQGGAWVKIS